MKTSSPRGTRLSRRVKILLSVAGAGLVIALVAVALLAFDPPLLARLTRNLPGAAVRVCTPSMECPSDCTSEKPPTRCGPGCIVGPYGNCQDKDLTYVLSNDKLILNYASLENCDLTASALTGPLIKTNLKGANLSYAALTGANLTSADLTGADTTDTTWTNVTFCNTTMPDGTVNNSDCP